MAVRGKDEIINILQSRIGEDTSDDALTLLEDVNDTLSDYDRRLAGSTDWETKYNELDASWRQKYKERFFQPTETVVEENKEDLIEESKPRSFDDLFKERKG